jgi:hypothetical protein
LLFSFDELLRNFGIIEGLANSIEGDYFIVKLSITKCVACATFAARTRLAATFGDNEGFVSIILERGQ